MVKVNVTPGLFAFPAFARAAASCGLGGRGGGEDVVGNSRPVRRVIVLRTVRLRQRIVRVARASLLCHDNTVVPRTKTRRFVVMMRHGGKVSATQTGVKARMRINRVVKAGLVVADVAEDCVLRYSVSRRNGSSKTSQRPVNFWRVSKISSRLLRCSESALFRFLFASLHTVLDSGLYLREYIPNINPATSTTGPAHLNTLSPYNTTNQNIASSKKLSHGSSVVHDNSPTT